MSCVWLSPGLVIYLARRDPVVTLHRVYQWEPMFYAIGLLRLVIYAAAEEGDLINRG